MQARRDRIAHTSNLVEAQCSCRMLAGPETAALAGVRRRRDRRHHGRQPRGAARLAVRRHARQPRRTAPASCPMPSPRAPPPSSSRADAEVAGAERVPCCTAAEPRRALALMAARFYPAQPAHHRRRHRHQRQDLGRRLHAPDLRRARPQGRLARHHRPGQARRQRLRRADHARSRLAAPDAGGAGGRGRHAPGLRGLLARPRPAPARRRAAEGGGLHQPRPRSSRLSPDDGGLSRGQAAPVHRAAAGRRHRRRQCRRRACRAR